MWASNGGVWGRGVGSAGEWGHDVVGYYTELERHQWLHVAFSIDDPGNTRICFNGSSRDTDLQPAGVAGNLNLASDMFLGNSPMAGSESER